VSAGTEASSAAVVAGGYASFSLQGSLLLMMSDTRSPQQTV